MIPERNSYPSTEEFLKSLEYQYYDLPRPGTDLAPTPVGALSPLGRESILRQPNISTYTDYSFDGLNSECLSDESQTSDFIPSSVGAESPNSPISPNVGSPAKLWSPRNNSSLRRRDREDPHKYHIPAPISEDDDEHQPVLSPGYKQVPCYLSDSRFVMYFCVMVSFGEGLFTLSTHMWTVDTTCYLIPQICAGVLGILFIFSEWTARHFLLFIYVVLFSSSFICRIIVNFVRMYGERRIKAYAQWSCARNPLFEVTLTEVDRSVLQKLCWKRAEDIRFLGLETFFLAVLFILNAVSTATLFDKLKHHARQVRMTHMW